VTVFGNVAIPGLLEVRETTRPALGAGVERVSARFCVLVPLMVRPDGEKPRAPLTVTARVAEL
jgi:hypothetical protein